MDLFSYFTLPADPVNFIYLPIWFDFYQIISQAHTSNMLGKFESY